MARACSAGARSSDSSRSQARVPPTRSAAADTRGGRGAQGVGVDLGGRPKPDDDDPAGAELSVRVQYGRAPDRLGDLLLGGEPAEPPLEGLVQGLGDVRQRRAVVREGDGEHIGLEGFSCLRSNVDLHAGADAIRTYFYGASRKLCEGFNRS